jgi:hypothetical protein
MISITYPNGYVGTYDETIKVGDIISAYLTGYHKVTKIEERGGEVPLFYYQMVADKNGKPKNSKENYCDAAYCRHAKETLIEEVAKKIKELEQLNSFLHTL